MVYNTFPPPFHLMDLVQSFWTLESDPHGTTPSEYFLMADNSPEIIFQYNEGFQAYPAQSARMRFQHSINDKFDVGRKVGFFGIRLHPHAVGQLLSLPAYEVVNHVFHFADIFRQEGTDLADQVYSAANTSERIARVSAYLMKRASDKTVDPIKYFVDQIIGHRGAIDIPEMQQASGLSVKQFERRFKAIAGFPPKYFARLTRFQAVKDSYAFGQFSSMTNLAYSCNYYDQSHFNREFKEFSGVQPLQYFKRAARENINFQKVRNRRLNTEKQREFNGYLPCGWFV